MRRTLDFDSFTMMISEFTTISFTTSTTEPRRTSIYGHIFLGGVIIHGGRLGTTFGYGSLKNAA
jgi:hypothetical protein